MIGTNAPTPISWRRSCRTGSTSPFRAITAALLAAYSAAVLASRMRAGVVAALLAALYTVLYVLLGLEAYSLLIGSLLLFAGLAATMWLTRRIDWRASGS